MEPLGTRPEFVTKAPAVSNAVDRLFGITGFVSALSRGDDERPLAFNRLDHIYRVAHVAAQAPRALELDLDSDPIDRVVWLHDLNRWPFAHNSEQGRYDQVKDLPRYLHDLGAEVDADDLTGIGNLHSWGSGRTTQAGIVGLLADKLAGTIEDSLLATCGLNLHPTVLGNALSHALDLPIQTPGEVARLSDLATTLHVERDVSAFRIEFHRLFAESVRRALRKLAADFGRGLTALPEWLGFIREVREVQVRPKIFPINNEMVARGSWLRAAVFQTLEASGVELPRQELLRWDEESFVDWALRQPPLIASGVTAVDFAPDLDYLARDRPEAALIRRKGVRFRPTPATPWAEITEPELSSMLVLHGVDTSCWGSGSAATVFALLRELRAGECELTIDAARLVRRVRLVRVDVSINTQDGAFRLSQSGQSFRKASASPRDIPAIDAKSHVDELPATAAVRALRNRLGIAHPLAALHEASSQTSEHRISDSRNFPGLATEYGCTSFVAEIDPRDFRPDGYVDRQLGPKITYVWQPLS